MLFAPAKRLLLKLTASYFCALIDENANENVLKRILIALHNKNKADFIQGLFSRPPSLPVQVVDKNRPIEAELFQLQF